MKPESEMTLLELFESRLWKRTDEDLRENASRYETQANGIYKSDKVYLLKKRDAILREIAKREKGATNE